MEAETTYKSCVVEANTRQNELEKVKVISNYTKTSIIQNIEQIFDKFG